MGLGFEIWDTEKPILDHGSRGQKGTGARIRIRITGSQLRFKYKDMSAKVDLHLRMLEFGDVCLYPDTLHTVHSSYLLI